MNKNLPKIKNKNSGCGKILCNMFLTKSVVSGEDYCDVKNGRPFIGYNANARLSELKALGFVRKAGIRKNKIKGGQSMFIYEITEKGIEKAKILLNN